MDDAAMPGPDRADEVSRTTLIGFDAPPLAPPAAVTPPADDFWQVDAIVAELSAIRRAGRSAAARHPEYGTEAFPSRTRLAKFAEELCGALFPLRLGPEYVRLHNEDTFVTQSLQIALSRLDGQLRLELATRLPDADRAEIRQRAGDIVVDFAGRLPGVRAVLDTDIEAAFRGDPSAQSMDEVLISFPGTLAIIHHRLAHILYRAGAPLVARIISEIAHGKTGIDIHPGASLGQGFFIDHGTGVVIGETAIVGNNVRIYQGVTLGAKSFPADEHGVLVKAIPRHPVIEDDVVIYAGASILGRVTIGRGSEIGGNTWITRDVPPGSRVFQAREQNLVTLQAGEGERRTQP